MDHHPLPKPAVYKHKDGLETWHQTPNYAHGPVAFWNSQQMHEYAAAAVAAEHEGALIALREWAVARWRAEVENRPLVNVHRRSLDDAWRQVIRHAGLDPDEVVGPSHDARLALHGA